MDIVVGEELCVVASCMGSGVVMLKHSSRGSQKWDDVWLQDFSNIPLCIQGSVDMHQGASGGADHTPHHLTSTGADGSPETDCKVFKLINSGMQFLANGLVRHAAYTRQCRDG